MAVRVGIGLFTGQVMPGSGRSFHREYREVVDLVQLAETVGFDSAWVSEHHGAGDGYLPSLLPMLAAFAAVTSRIRLGTGVVLAPFHDPLRLAEDCAVVDQLSGGRLVLGLGLGWREEEFRMWNQPASERARRTEEIVEVLRRAWTGERFSFEGRHYAYDRVQITPAPAADLPIYLGGTVERAVRRAGRLGDGYVRSRSDVESAVHALAWAEDAARAAGRDPAELRFTQLQSAFVAEDGSAWATVVEGARHHLGVYTGWAEGSDTPGNGFWISPPPDEAIRGVVAAGTTDEVLARLRRWIDAFGDRPDFELVVRLHYPGMPYDTAAQAIELFARKVLPGLKSD